MKSLKRLLLFAIFVVPLGSDVFSFSVAGFQMTLFRLILVIMLVGIMISKKGKVKIGLMSNRPFVIYMGLLALYAVISGLWSKDFSLYIRNSFFILIGFLSILVMNNINETREDILNCLISFEFGCLLQGIIGWKEIITGVYSYVPAERVYQMNAYGAMRVPVAMQYNPNTFATLMFFCCFVSFGLFKEREEKKKKVIHLLVMINSITLVILTTSRANLIGVLIGFSLILFLGDKKKVAIGFLATIPLLFIPNVSLLFNNFSALRLLGTEASDNTRINLIKNGIHFMLNTFGFGVGAGQSYYWMGHYAIYNTMGVQAMHNYWIEILSDYGIVFFIGFVAYYAGMFIRNMKMYRNRINNGISLGLIAALSGFIISSLSSSSCITSETIWTFWAIVICYIGIGGIELYELNQSR